MINELEFEEKNKIVSLSRTVCISFSTSETLAAHVVVYRALNIEKEIALLCMKELARRRKHGESFDYESYIEEKIKMIPKMKGLNIPTLGRKIMNARTGLI